MPEYIDREDYCKNLCHCNNEYCDKESCPIWKAPAADVAPVVHGRWVSVPYKLARVCSVCNRDEPYKFADIDADVYDYCPYCGAKMDGGDNSATD